MMGVVVQNLLPSANLLFNLKNPNRCRVNYQLVLIQKPIFESHSGQLSIWNRKTLAQYEYYIYMHNGFCKIFQLTVVFSYIFLQ